MADTSTRWLLHDAELSSLAVDWKTGRVEMNVSYWPDERYKIVAEDLRSLTIPRQFPWGPSVFINETHGPEATLEGLQLLRIQVQSGDEIELLAREIQLPPKRTRDDDPRNIFMRTSDNKDGG